MNHIKTALPDILMVGGAAALAYGAWLSYPPAGFITGGILALVFGVLSAVNTQRASK